MEKLYSIRKIILLVLLGLVLTSSLAVFTYAADSSSLVNEKNLENATNSKTEVIKDIEKNVKNLDLDKLNSSSLSDAGGNAALWGASLLYKASRGMGYYGAYLTKFSVDFDLFDECQDVMDKPFKRLKKLTLGSFNKQVGMIFIACTLAVVVFLVLKGRIAAGMGKMLQIIAVMLIAMFFFTTPLNFLKDANTLAKDFGLSVFEFTQKNENKESSTNAAVKTVWETMAENPWLTLQFDSMSDTVKAKVDNKDKLEYKLKHLEPEDGERKTAAETLAETYRPLKEGWSVQSDRLGTAFLMLLMNSVIFIIILAITLFTLGLQVLILILGLVTPFVFLMALFPSKGMGVIKNWALVLLMGYVGIAFTLFAFGIFLMLLNLVYGTLIAKIGIFLSFMVILSFIIMVWVFRRSILGIFGDTSSLDRFESRAERHLMRHYMRHRNPEGSLPTRAVKGAGKMVGSGASHGVRFAGRKARGRFEETEAGKKWIGRKQAKQMDKNAMRSDWQEDVDKYAEDKRGYYSRAEQDKNARENAKRQNEDSAAGENQQDHANKSHVNQDSQKGNLRDHVRSQQKENQKTGSEPQKKWKMDANGIPYREGSTIDQTLRKQVNKDGIDNPGSSTDHQASPGGHEKTPARNVREQQSNHQGAHASFNLYEETPGYQAPRESSRPAETHSPDYVASGTSRQVKRQAPSNPFTKAATDTHPAMNISKRETNRTSGNVNPRTVGGTKQQRKQVSKKPAPKNGGRRPKR